MASEIQEEALPETTFAESMLGKGFFENAYVKKFLSWPEKWQVITVAAVFAALIFVPYLGAVGLWDPWEPHYGEVARSMIQRNDYVHPYWESTWFFSKPILTMWITALGMQIVGTNRTTVDQPLALYTEWGMRLPMALMSIGALCLLALALSRTVSKRTGFSSIFVLATMPLYFLLTRQAVTDTPFVTTQIGAFACAIIGQFDTETKHRSGWWYGFWVLTALSTLAKEIFMGLGIPAVSLALYACFCVIPWSWKALDEHIKWLFEPAYRAEVRAGKAPMPTLWAQMYKMRFGTGFLVFCSIALPWLIAMSFFHGRDDEGQTFLYRYWIHDQLARFFSGVHTTTPGGTFTYFIEEGGYAIYPWVALVPGAIAVLARVKLRSNETRHHVTMLVAIWSILAFTIVGSSATKFHHYIFPALPGLAVLIGLFIDRLWTDGIKKHAGALMLGVPFLILVGKDLAENPKQFTDLFVYNYDRPYPMQEVVMKPYSLFGMRSLWVGDIVTLVLLGLGGYMLFESFTDKTRPIFNRAFAMLLALCGLSTLVAMGSGGNTAPTLFIGLAFGLVAVFLGYEASAAKPEDRNGLWAGAILVGLIGVGLVGFGIRTPAPQDPILLSLRDPVNVKTALGFGFFIFGALAVIAALMQARVMLFGTFGGLALAFAIWFNWSHWVDLSHHWTQRDQYWVYYRMRKPDEPITAFLMNWRGETFYSKNTVKQIKENPRLTAYANLPGRKWAQVEHNRFGILKGAVGPDHTVTVIDKDLNDKFMLVTIE